MRQHLPDTLIFKVDSRAAIVAGVDEVGRGPLCGPVIAAAVILDEKQSIEGLRDSKKLSEKKRELFFDEIKSKSRAWCIGRAEVEEIDRLNILHASLLAMRRAVLGLSMMPDLALIDGNRCPELPCRAEAIVRGDSKVSEIAAASILAKVTRDREMQLLDCQNPGYGIAGHKGYPTKAHLEVLKKLGPTAIYRRSFKPVSVLLGN
ncbi:MAG: ribonuclease HII [Candidatus Endonucleobacter bathymodioli]|uniref:Ribonuclease HII n=1 Tax=Candidatus Endonucleibacter bathymodioli TaxID=539814 RepID=A0AA90SDX8_9GAMM|nr:ribonuclease HII [Candidatus Endonucleobacter bathymodioli]